MTEVKPVGVGTAIKMFRDLWDLTLYDVGQKTKLSPQFLSAVEAESRAPSLDSLERIAKALNVPANLILRVASRNAVEIAAHLDSIKQ